MLGVRLISQQNIPKISHGVGTPPRPTISSTGGLNNGTGIAMVNHLRFTQDLIRLRWNHPALRGDNFNPFYVHDANRVIAFHRWLVKLPMGFCCVLLADSPKPVLTRSRAVFVQKRKTKTPARMSAAIGREVNRRHDRGRY